MRVGDIGQDLARMGEIRRELASIVLSTGQGMECRHSSGMTQYIIRTRVDRSVSNHRARLSIHIANICETTSRTASVYYLLVGRKGYLKHKQLTCHICCRALSCKPSRKLIEN